MDNVGKKLIGIWVAVFILVAFFILSGCSTTPPANIVIGGNENCPPSKIVMNILTDSAISNEGLANSGKADKQLTGDAATLHDDDGGQAPSLGL